MRLTSIAAFGHDEDKGGTESFLEQLYSTIFHSLRLGWSSRVVMSCVNQGRGCKLDGE